MQEKGIMKYIVTAVIAALIVLPMYLLDCYIKDVFSWHKINVDLPGRIEFVKNWVNRDTLNAYVNFSYADFKTREDLAAQQNKDAEKLIDYLKEEGISDEEIITKSGETYSYIGKKYFSESEADEQKKFFGLKNGEVIIRIKDLSKAENITRVLFKFSSGINRCVKYTARNLFDNVMIFSFEITEGEENNDSFQKILEKLPKAVSEMKKMLKGEEFDRKKMHDEFEKHAEENKKELIK